MQTLLTDAGPNTVVHNVHGRRRVEGRREGQSRRPRMVKILDESSIRRLTRHLGFFAEESIDQAQKSGRCRRGI